MTTFPTKPEPREVNPEHAAILVVDMQNAFASKGGMFDLSGLDISGARRVIHVLQEVLEVGRRAGLQIVYLQVGYDAQLTTSGGPDSPNWHKELALRLIRQHPELKGKVLTQGEWDWEVVDELTPHPEDLVVNKTRYSGFYGTPLDSMLRTRGIRTLFFAGIATNVCVESTLRDAFFLDYWPILLHDATMQAGPALLQEATVMNVENYLGWTLTAAEFVSHSKQGWIGVSLHPGAFCGDRAHLEGLPMLPGSLPNRKLGLVTSAQDVCRHSGMSSISHAGWTQSGGVSVFSALSTKHLPSLAGFG